MKKVNNLKNSIATFTANAPEIINNLLALFFLYIAMFLIQVIILPILFFWLIIKTSNRLFDSKLPILIKQTELSERLSS